MSGLAEHGTSARGVGGGRQPHAQPQGLVVDITAGGEVSPRKWLHAERRPAGRRACGSAARWAAPRAGLEMLQSAAQSRTVTPARESRAACSASPAGPAGAARHRDGAGRRGARGDGPQRRARRRRAAAGDGQRMRRAGGRRACPSRARGARRGGERAARSRCCSDRGGEDYELLFAVPPRAGRPASPRPPACAPSRR